MRHLALALAFVLASGLATVAPARAQPQLDAKTAAGSEAQAAQKLYEDGQYHDAATHFAHAYELDPQAAYLFDAAQAYRFAKECATAAKYYLEFLDVAK